eukprot:948118-Pyramimonas_sp.AAC.1
MDHLCACALATCILCATASTPVTSAPIRAKGSHSSPPPHPTSSIFKPEKGSRMSVLSPKCAQTAERMNWQRICAAGRQAIELSRGAL